MPDSNSRPSRNSSANQSPSPRPAGRRFRSSDAPSSAEKSGVHAPINAAAAAKHAAHATRPEDEARARRAASGTQEPAVPAAARRQNGKRTVAIAVLVGCALAALLLFVLGNALLGVMLYDDRADSLDTAALVDGNTSANGGDASAEEPQGVARYADGDTIDAMSYTYSIATSEDGRTIFGYQIQGSSAAPIELLEVAGDPVGFVMKNYVFYIVSNTEDGFCVQSILHADGGVASIYRTGDVTVEDIDLDGSDLVLTGADGNVYTVALGGTE